MYTEEVKKKINWSNIIKKGLLLFLVILIIFLIIWLFTKNNNKPNVNFEENDTNNGTITNKEAYTNEFITGYTYFHDTIKDYLLTEGTLPTNGNSVKYTLKELTDKGIILPFIYKDGETCDLEGSYVMVTNNNGKYDMTVMLVCGKEVAKTTEELGCNQLCVSGNCEVVVKPTEPDDEELAYEYQFKQGYTTTETVYTCPSGYTKSGTLCVKDNKTTTNAIKKTTYNCPAGYEKVGLGSSTTCVRTNNKEIEPTVTVTYSCEKGYTKTGDGASTVCTKEINANKTTNYNCPSGYTKSGSGASTKCTKTTTASVTPTYSCPSGYSLSGKQCVKTEPKVVVSYNYSCSKGKLNGTKCQISTAGYYIYEPHYEGPIYQGCTWSGVVPNTCAPSDRSCVKNYQAYYCSGSSYSEEATKTPVYGCTSGTPSGNNCVTTIDATPSCSKGTLSSDKTKCVYNTSSEAKPSVTNKYSCTNGVLNGSKCVITDNSKLIKNTTTSCPNGFSKNGNVCVSKGIDYQDYIIKTEYICRSGYTMYGEGASAVCTKGETVKVNAEKETKTVTKYRYKWSTETYLEGWERTGKSRQTKISSK